MKKRLLFIYNPNAGKGKVKSKISGIVEILSAAGFEVIIYPTTAKLDARRIAIEYVAADLCDRIVCAGGDGTLNEITGGLMMCGKVVPVGYIPSGTTNDFGYSLKIPKNILDAARIAVSGTTFYCDTGSINGIHFTYTASFGLFSDVSYDTPQNFKNVLGRAAYILSGISKLGSVKPYYIRVELEDEFMEDDFLLGIISNSDSVGGFHGLTGKGVLFDDGLFEMILVRMPRNVLDLNNIIVDLLRGGMESEYILYRRFSKLHITSEDSLLWSLDGEDGGNMKDAEIIVHKQAIPYICKMEGDSEEEPVYRDLKEETIDRR